MQSVPKYQVVEFLQWLKEKHEIPSIDNRELLYKYALEYLSSNQIRKVDDFLAKILFIFQGCSMISESRIEEQVEHFCGCGSCYGFEIYGSKNENQLHPFLLGFINFIKNKHPEFNDKIKRFYEKYGRGENEKYLFREAISEFGRELRHLFHLFVEESDKEIIDSFLEYREELKRGSYYEKGQRRASGGEIDLNSRSVETEASRLVHSLIHQLDDSADFSLSKFFAREIGIENISTLEFLDWLKQNYPQLNITGDIPSDKLLELVETFCNQNSYSNTKELKNEVEKIFRGQMSPTAFRRIKNWLFNKGEGRGKENPFDRYRNVKFHGIFLYLSFGEGNLESFINESWKELNSLTADYMDIYFSQEDISKRNGFDVLNEINSLQNIEVTQLPALIIWEEKMTEAIAIPLGELSNKNKFQTIQYVVQAIKDEKSIAEVGSFAIDFINSKIESLTPKKVEIIMGDKYKFEKSQFGAVGPNSKAEGNTFQQINSSNSLPEDFNYEELSKELALLWSELAKKAETTEQRESLALVSEAEAAAKKKDGNKVVKALKSAGTWVFDTARDIGVEIAAEVIKKQMEM